MKTINTFKFICLMIQCFKHTYTVLFQEGIKYKGPLTVVIEVRCIAAYYFQEIKSWSNTPVFMYKLTVSPYFVILDSGFCYIKYTALFWGRNGHFLY